MSALEKLRGKQHAFVLEYVKDFNATQAAIRAGYSPKTARVIAAQNLSKLNIRAAIEEEHKQRAERKRISIDRVVEEIAKIAFSNAADYFEWSASGVTIKDSGTLTRDQTAAIGEVSETVTQHGGSIRIKMHSKLDALRDLGKHLGMFDDEGRDKRGPEEVARDILKALQQIDQSTGGSDTEMDDA